MKENNMTELHRYNTLTWIETIWEALYLIHPQAVTEEQHDDIMSAMAWITEELFVVNNDHWDELIAVCPHCNNPDPHKTVYVEEQDND
jgi:hypothetical protein